MPGPDIDKVFSGSIATLYDTYLVARQRCGEPTDGISYESVASRIRAQVPQLLEKHKAKNRTVMVTANAGRRSSRPRLGRVGALPLVAVLTAAPGRG